MRKLRHIALLTAAMALIGACSGDSGTYAESEYESTAETAPPATMTLDPANDEPYDAVFFDNPGVNPFIDTEDDSLSTFGLDVDTGSYTVARRFLVDGNLPDKDSVRVEEFINYFDQDYPIPTMEEGLGVVVDGGVTPFLQNERNRVIRVGIQATELADEERPDANLVFVIDTSGSMEREDRLSLVKRSLELLVANLRPSDTVGIVEYGSQARVVLPPTPVGEEGEILRAIWELRPNGSTNAAEGLRLGYRMVDAAFREGGINRVILCSDGVANTGPATGAEGILELISAETEQGIDLVTLGFGMGNYNDILMEQLADQGDGFYAYVDTIDEAGRVLVESLTGTLVTVARDARVQVEFDPRQVQSWRLVGFENRAIADEQFRDDSIDAGEIGAGHTVTALYEVKPTADAGSDLGVVRLRWIDPATGTARETEEVIASSDLAAEFESAAARFQLDILVAQYAEILRGSIWAQQIGIDLGDLNDHVGRLQRLFPEDPDVVEFIGLVRQAASISS
jgi:Ca-activated chloride channel family protein